MNVHESDAQSSSGLVVIIPTKNEERNLGRLLDSLVADGFSKSDIVVVDNYSDDRTQEIARAFGIPLYVCSPNQSAQRNFGVKNTDSLTYVFLDADMEVQRGLRLDLLALKDQGAECAIIPEISVWSNLLSRGKAVDRRLSAGDLSSESARFFSRRLFLECGMYDENVTGGEDWILSWRASQLQPVHRTTHVVLHHEGDPTFRSVFLKYVKYGRGYFLLWRQHAAGFLEHANPIRSSVVANLGTLRRPGDVVAWITYKTLTYAAGGIGFALEALESVFRASSSAKQP